MSGFQVDISDFLKNLDLADQVVRDAAEKGLREAGNQLIDDAINKAPRAPHLHGPLRDSARTELPEHDANGQVTVKVGFGSGSGFNVPYAARWHEAENDIDPITGKKINWSEPGVGGKFLETKMVAYDENYKAITAAKIKEVLGK